MRELHRPDETFGKLIPAQTPRPGIFYVPSQFSLSFSHRGTACVFNTLTKQCVEAELPESTTAGAGYDDLIKARFLVPEGTDEAAFYDSVRTLLKLYYLKDRKPAYTILPTLGCNARCVYCFQEGMQQIGMTSETVEDTLRFILNDCGGKEITLSWFGGEPLLREDVIDQITGGIKEAGVEYKSLMVTNGSLITPEMIIKMTELWHLERIQISMDGKEEDYIARKRYIRYCDNYHTVIANADRMAAAGISVQIRSNTDENNISDIDCFIEDLANGISHKENVSVYLTPLYDAMQKEHRIELWSKILSMRSVIAKSGFTVLLDYFNDALSTQRCMADGGGIVVAPDGTLYCCEHLPKDSRIGDVFQGVTDENVRMQFVGADKRPAKCRNCVFLPDCMPISGCPNFGFICMDARMLFMQDALHRIIEKAEKRIG